MLRSIGRQLLRQREMARQLDHGIRCVASGATPSGQGVPEEDPQQTTHFGKRTHVNACPQSKKPAGTPARFVVMFHDSLPTAA